LIHDSLSGKTERPETLVMGLFDKLKQGLTKTRAILRTDVRDLFRSGEILDDDALESFESRGIKKVMGVAAASSVFFVLK
jgi:fused signal recognition particle receptor